uniref:Homing endonuclease LAGLIDADG domain-containing protein n=1 Tax=Percursaria percursa TaxID=153906 RepID=A0A8K1MXF7_9CHLO|nr:hypothetical protein [Percursaria percursa]
MIKKSLLINRVYQQETFTCNGYSTVKGSSETERRLTFQYNDYINVQALHKVHKNQTFLTWFIGFVEGDGSFIISHDKVYFDLTQDLKDIKLLYLIKNTLGFGKILTRTEKHRNVGVFYVTGKTNFIRLAHLFNGNLITSYKKKQFTEWLAVFNKQYNQEILLIDSNIKPCFISPWLSGFIDAEGCFAARVKNCHTSKLGKNLFIDFSIGQKDADVLQSIRNLFNIGTKYKKVRSTKEQRNIRFDPSWTGYIFYLSNKKKLIPLIKYLEKYPLKTKKRIDFHMWSRIHRLGIKKVHLTEPGLKYITKLCYEKKQVEKRSRKKIKEKLKIQSDLD